MKKSLIILALCAFSSSAFADTLFSCTTTNGKQIKLTDKGETLEYRFGKALAEEKLAKAECGETSGCF